MTWTIAVAPRFPGKLPKLSWPSIGKGSLADTELSFPPNAPRHWIDLFTEEILEVPGTGRVRWQPYSGAFPSHFSPRCRIDTHRSLSAATRFTPLDPSIDRDYATHNRDDNQPDHDPLDHRIRAPFQNALAEAQCQRADQRKPDHARDTRDRSAAASREYCSAAAAMTNAVNGNGGGASDAIVSAIAAFCPPSFESGPACASRDASPALWRRADASVRSMSRQPSTEPTVDIAA